MRLTKLTEIHNLIYHIVFHRFPLLMRIAKNTNSHRLEIEAEDLITLSLFYCSKINPLWLDGRHADAKASRTLLLPPSLHCQMYISEGGPGEKQVDEKTMAANFWYNFPLSCSILGAKTEYNKSEAIYKNIFFISFPGLDIKNLSPSWDPV